MWLLSTLPSKLKNSLATGPKVQLMHVLPSDVDKSKEGKSLSTDVPAKELNPSFLMVDAASQGSSAQPRCSQKHKKSSKQGKAKCLDSDDDKEEEQTFLAEVEAQRVVARELGKEPSGKHMETLNEWEGRTGETFSIEHAELVIWVFIKWDDLTYDEAKCSQYPQPLGTLLQFPPMVDILLFCILASVSLTHVWSSCPKKDKKAIKQFDDQPMQMFQQKQLLLKSDPELG
ncbi:hypothetical protein K439DRAFT_1622785 [Ramaria rubella]|nr:hypothetical protein K439DRAFT_1622785 [Ramaria rubella]